MMLRRFFQVFWMIALSLSAPSGSFAQTNVDEFSVASNLEAAEKFSEAAKAYADFATRHPEHALAPEALFQAGILLQEKLQDLQTAAETFSAIVARYPENRVALAAQKRLLALTPMVSQNPADKAATLFWQTLLHKADALPSDELLSSMRTLEQTWPTWPGFDQAFRTLSEVAWREGNLRMAKSWLEKWTRKFPQHEQSATVYASLARIDIEMGLLDEARAWLNKARFLPNGNKYELSEIARVIAQKQTERHGLGIALLVAGLSLVFLVARKVFFVTRLACRPILLVEIWIFLPFAAILLFASWRNSADLGKTIGCILLAGLIALLTLVPNPPPTRWSRLLRVGGFTMPFLLVFTTAYVALTYWGYWTLLLDTLRYGPEV